MARPRGSINLDKQDPKVLRARRDARERNLMRGLRLSSGRKRVWVIGEDGKIREKWI